MNPGDLNFTLFTIGAVLAGSGGILFGSKFPEGWRNAGLIMAVVGSVICIIVAMMISAVGFGLITLIMLCLVILMLRQGLLPRP